MEYAVSKWLNTDTMKPVFGVIGMKDGKKYNIAQDGKPLFFDDEAEAQDMVDTMNELPRCAICGKPMTFTEPKVHDPELGDCCAEHFSNE